MAPSSRYRPEQECPRNTSAAPYTRPRRSNKTPGMIACAVHSGALSGPRRPKAVNVPSMPLGFTRRRTQASSTLPSGCSGSPRIATRVGGASGYDETTCLTRFLRRMLSVEHCVWEQAKDGLDRSGPIVHPARGPCPARSTNPRQRIKSRADAIHVRLECRHPLVRRAWVRGGRTLSTGTRVTQS